MCWETSGVSVFRLPHCWLQVNMHPERTATDRPTDRLVTSFLASSVLQTNAVTVPKIPSCCCMICLQPSQFKFIRMSLFRVHKLLLQIRNQFRSPLFIIQTFSFSSYYQKDERAKPGTN
jgi:hypothetical protein